MSLSDDSETLMRVSETSEIIEGIAVPTWVEFITSGGADPDRRIRVELRDGAPQIVELAWCSGLHQSEVRQKHCRALDLASLATDLMVSTLARGQKSRQANVSTRVEQIRQSKNPRSETDYADYVDASVALLRQAKREAQNAERVTAKFVERQRRPREYRQITDNSFLKSVAEVYRDNFDGTPRKAVAQHFGVTDRVASTYIGKARSKGFLSPTKQGQKKW